MARSTTISREGTAEAFRLTLRYIAAIVVAFLVSSLIMFVGSALFVGIIPFLAGAECLSAACV